MLYKKIIRRIKRKLSKRTFTNEKFESDYKLFTSLDKENRFECLWDDIQPCLNDNTSETWFDTHYIYHPAWACRIVKEINPREHVDISSTLSFCSQLSAFIPVRFFDYRPAKLQLSNLYSGKADLNKLPFPNSSIESISCMHTIEHIGLGRYGDKIDPQGDLKAFEELKRVVKAGGSLLIVVPMGIPRIKFNAHRIYSYEMIDKIFREDFICRKFSFLNDVGEFAEKGIPEEVKLSNFGCGCFWFIKK